MSTLKTGMSMRTDSSIDTTRPVHIELFIGPRPDRANLDRRPIKLPYADQGPNRTGPSRTETGPDRTNCGPNSFYQKQNEQK